MNKRRREILSKLQPATDHALIQSGYRPDAPPQARDVPGLAMTARPTAEAPAEIMIYGRIGGGGWFMDGISASDVAALLREAGPGPIDVRINSGGGDVFDGVAIHSLLARHPGAVTCYVDGLAASAASFIMLAGDRIVAVRNSFVMIHDAMTYTYGNGDTHRAAGELLDKVSENIADMYAERAGEDVEYWRNLMTVNGEDGTWYTGLEALDAGLVDEVTGAAEDDDAETEDASVARLLMTWEALLPESARAFLNAHAAPSTKPPVPKPTPEPSAVDWDAAQFLEQMKGCLA